MRPAHLDLTPGRTLPMTFASFSSRLLAVNERCIAVTEVATVMTFTAAKAFLSMEATARAEAQRLKMEASAKHTWLAVWISDALLDGAVHFAMGSTIC